MEHQKTAQNNGLLRLWITVFRFGVSGGITRMMKNTQQLAVEYLERWHRERSWAKKEVVLKEHQLKHDRLMMKHVVDPESREMLLKSLNIKMK